MTETTPENAQASMPARSPYRLWLHGLAGALSALILGLIAVGGNVTSLDAGMAVPDWPGTFGYNMFLAPLNHWFYNQGTFWEHFHRLNGSLVGVVTIALAVSLWITQRTRPWLRWLGMTLLGMVIVQGLMGGFRVTENSVFLAGVHGVFGQLVLAAAVLITAAVGRKWTDAHADRDEAVEPGPPFVLDLVFLPLLPIGALLGSMALRARENPALITWGWSDVGTVWVIAMTLFMLVCAGRLTQAFWQARRVRGARREEGGGVRCLAIAVFLALCLQLVLGAAVRHSGAEKAIPDAPLSYGGVMPPMSQEKLDVAIAELPEDLRNRVPLNTTAGQVHLHFTHRVGAVGVVVLTLLLAINAITLGPIVKIPLIVTLVVMGAQVMLGIMTVWSNIYPTLATGHQAVGALLLASVTWLVVRVHLASPSPAAQAAPRAETNASEPQDTDKLETCQA